MNGASVNGEPRGGRTSPLDGLMNMARRSALALLVLGLVLLASFADAANDEVPSGEGLATIDLATDEGVKSVAGAWRYSDTTIVATTFPSAGPEGQPAGAPVPTYDYAPHAGGVDFDDSAWPVLAPKTLSARRGNGRLGFNWYRIVVTVPETVGGVRTNGTTVVFEVSVDDYAEVWVDGELTRATGQSGGSVIAGWNASNRLVVARHAKPGQKIVLAVFGANGPLSNPPTNYIYLRSAKLSFHPASPGGVAIAAAEVNVEVRRENAGLDAIVGANPKVFKIADGFEFTEGPVWSRADRSLLFSDPNDNVIYRYGEAGTLSVFRRNSGYDGPDIGAYRQPGSNGLALDADGRLVINEHGNRRVTRLEKSGKITVLADSYGGKRLNSPNDLVYASDGSLYFTDPPFGLPGVFDDPHKELAFSGIYRVAGGKVELLDDGLSGPNGIALSPDEKVLYVGNWDEKNKVVMRYPLEPDGRLGKGEVFFDMTSAKGEDAIDGIEVDGRGNLYVSGPGGIWILSSDATHLGTIVTPQHVHNMAWGGEDGKSLYLCARKGLYRMPLGIAGANR